MYTPVYPCTLLMYTHVSFMFTHLHLSTYFTQYLSATPGPAPSHTPYLRLILQILPNLPRGEVPDFHKPIGTASHQVLAVGRESGTFWVRLAPKFDGLGEEGGVLFFLHILDSCPAPEGVCAGVCGGIIVNWCEFNAGKNS